MTEEVAELVLRDNYAGTQTCRWRKNWRRRCSTYTRASSSSIESRQAEPAAGVPPKREESDRRQMVWLTRPELAVLLAYAKITVMYESLVDSNDALEFTLM